MSVKNAGGTQPSPKPSPARRKQEAAPAAPPPPPEPPPEEPKLEDQTKADNSSDATDAQPEPPQPEPPQPEPEPRSLTIAFVEDGFIALGRTWYRGQELTVEEHSDEWERTLSDGESWMELDEDAQVRRWGRRIFRHGHWTGQGYDLNDPNLTPSEREQLAAAIGAKIETPGKSGPSRPPKL